MEHRQVLTNHKQAIHHKRIANYSLIFGNMKSKFINKMFLLPSVGFLAFLPALVSAQSFAYLGNIITFTGTLVGMAVPVLVGLALLFFIWGLVLFILNSGNEQERAVGKQRMVWGVVALFVIVSVWGLVLLLQQITGVNGLSFGLASPQLLP
jgi:hypothetical protein